MPARNFERAMLRTRRRSTPAGTGYGEPTPVPKPVPPRTQFFKWCLRCSERFEYAPDDRRPLVRCCDECRVDLERQALLNGIDADLPDADLVAAIRGRGTR